MLQPLHMLPEEPTTLRNEKLLQMQVDVGLTDLMYIMQHLILRNHIQIFINKADEKDGENKK